MELSKEEREVLEKKIKEHRRSMWEGKRPSGAAREEKSEKTTTSPRSAGRRSERKQSNAAEIRRGASGNTAPGADYRVPKRIGQKSRIRKQGAWQSKPVGGSRKRPRWGVANGEMGKHWNPVQTKEVKPPFRWKLALGVFGAILALILVGVGLGYFLAR